MGRERERERERERLRKKEREGVEKGERFEKESMVRSERVKRMFS